MNKQKRLLIHLRECLEALKHREKHYLLSVSGGVDSMVMLDAILKLREVLRARVSVCYVNHHLRSDSHLDKKLIEDYLCSFDVPFIVRSVFVRETQKEKKYSLEMASHYLRKEALLDVARKEGADIILTGHHQEDQIETIFMRLGFGTGREGINGISQNKDIFVRPMLSISKSDIYLYQKENKVPFLEDFSNKDISISRNFWRHEIIPKIEERFGEGYFKNMLKTVENVGWTEEDYDNLDKELEYIKYKDEFAVVDISRLKTYFSAFGKAFIESVIWNFFSISYILNKREYSLLIRLCQKGESGLKLHLGSSIELLVSFGKLYLYRSLEQKDKQTQKVYSFLINKELRIDNKVLTLSECDNVIFDDNFRCEYIDKEKLEGRLRVRTVCAGDFFYPIGLGKKQTINRYLKSKRVAIPYRKYKYVLTEGENIVWLLGYRLDSRYKITPETKTVLKLEIKYDNE